MTIQKIIETGIIPIFSHEDKDLSLKVIELCYEAGFRAFEFTNRQSNSLEVFEYLSENVKLKMPQLALGIGTIFNAKNAVDFINIGADFIVSPVFQTETLQVCKQNGVPYIPGVFTPAEIYNAIEAGAELIKIFPGEGVSPEYIKAIRGPLPNIKIMVTGGVKPERENIEKWLSAGVNCVGIGSKLINIAPIVNGNFEELKNKLNECAAIISTLKKS